MQKKILWAVAGILAFQSATWANGILGVAQDYNAFIFGNMNQSSDSEGALAVGGNLTLTSYSVASSLGNTGTHLVVGKNLTMITGGSVNGDSYIGGDASFGVVAPTGNVYDVGNYSSFVDPTGTVYYGKSFSAPSWVKPAVKDTSITLPVDFNQAQTDLTTTSKYLNGLTNTGTYVDSFGALTFTGSVDGLNVFSISASELAAGSEIHINIPSNGFAIVNVTGATSVTLPNVGFWLNSADVLWNLYDFSSITMGSFDGSILAPSAAVSFPSGDLNGTLVAASLDDTVNGGSGELHNVPFTYNIPVLTGAPPTTVPLPPSVIAGGALLGILGLVKLRKRRRDSL
ncbi:MAG TPA: choice-of-anchor A family protein [Tepidisphaeraceae bacterium]|jgi:choice-of-anchor A domain-containing protein